MGKGESGLSQARETWGKKRALCSIAEGRGKEGREKPLSSFPPIQILHRGFCSDESSRPFSLRLAPGAPALGMGGGALLSNLIKPRRGAASPDQAERRLPFAKRLFAAPRFGQRGCCCGGERRPDLVCTAPPAPHRCRGARVEAVRAFDSDLATPPDSQVPPRPPSDQSSRPTEPRGFK